MYTPYQRAEDASSILRGSLHCNSQPQRVVLSEPPFIPTTGTYTLWMETSADRHHHKSRMQGIVCYLSHHNISLYRSVLLAHTTTTDADVLFRMECDSR
jgi:hypothetical protein